MPNNDNERAKLVALNRAKRSAWQKEYADHGIEPPRHQSDMWNYGFETGYLLGFDAGAAHARQEPVAAVLFCPNCGEQHVDEARPDVCELCGADEGEHWRDGQDEQVGRCQHFTAWLNPPHKSHRCEFCNHVWRPMDAPTNGVRELSRHGERDGSSTPRYFATKKDFDDAVAYVCQEQEQEQEQERRIGELEQDLYKFECAFGTVASLLPEPKIARTISQQGGGEG